MIKYHRRQLGKLISRGNKLLELVEILANDLNLEDAEVVQDAHNYIKEGVTKLNGLAQATADEND